MKEQETVRAATVWNIGKAIERETVKQIKQIIATLNTKLDDNVKCQIDIIKSQKSVISLKPQGSRQILKYLTDFNVTLVRVPAVKIVNVSNLVWIISNNLVI